MNGITSKPVLIDELDGELASKLVTAIADDNERAQKRKAEKKKHKKRRGKKRRDTDAETE